MLRFSQQDGPQTANKNGGGHAEPWSPTRQGGSIEGGERVPRRLRTVLSIGFGGLLVIMFIAGFTALETLRELHAVEENGRREYITRNQALMRVTFLVSTYDGQVERYLLSPNSVEGAVAPGNIARQAAEAHAALRSYPWNRETAEQLLLEDMERQLSDEERTVQSMLSRSVEERRRLAPEAVNELMPRRLQILETSQQIAVSNRQRLNDGPLLAEFSVLRSRLARMVFLALMAGLLLSLMSTLYILRLEGQAQRRYEELARSRRELEELSARLVDAQ
jgi:hypothetical protein